MTKKLTINRETVLRLTRRAVAINTWPGCVPPDDDPEKTNSCKTCDGPTCYYSCGCSEDCSGGPHCGD